MSTSFPKSHTSKLSLAYGTGLPQRELRLGGKTLWESPASALVIVSEAQGLQSSFGCIRACSHDPASGMERNPTLPSPPPAAASTAALHHTPPHHPILAFPNLFPLFLRVAYARDPPRQGTWGMAPWTGFPPTMREGRPEPGRSASRPRFGPWTDAGPD